MLPRYRRWRQEEEHDGDERAVPSPRRRMQGSILTQSSLMPVAQVENLLEGLLLLMRLGSRCPHGGRGGRGVRHGGRGGDRRRRRGRCQQRVEKRERRRGSQSVKCHRIMSRLVWRNGPGAAGGATGAVGGTSCLGGGIIVVGMSTRKMKKIKKTSQASGTSGMAIVAPYRDGRNGRGGRGLGGRGFRSRCGRGLRSRCCGRHFGHRGLGCRGGRGLHYRGRGGRSLRSRGSGRDLLVVVWVGRACVSVSVHRRLEIVTKESIVASNTMSQLQLPLPAQSSRGASRQAPPV